jgi:NitT/TauT family transport system permease protein
VTAGAVVGSGARGAGFGGSGREWRIGARVIGALPAIGVFIVVIVAWELVLGALGIQQFLIPRPSVIVAALIDQWPVLQKGVIYTGTEALGGLAVGSTLALLAAFATSRWVAARESLLPVAVAANSIPIIAFAPIANNWFSSESPASRITIVALMTFFPMMINAVRGLTTVDPSALELMHSYAASEGQVLRRLRIPNALPYIFTALRVTTTLSVIGAVVGEYFGGPTTALGIYITSEAGLFRYPNAWAAILLACALGIVLYLAVITLERLVLPWHAAAREQAV